MNKQDVAPSGRPAERKLGQEGDAKHPAPPASLFRVRLPGFLVDEETGLGDVIKKATYAMGLKPCESCEQRATTLNSWMQFTRW
jgi:hypothetical protein